MREVNLVDSTPLSPSVRLLTFEGWPSLAYQPGQWLNLHANDAHGQPMKRSYSIACAPRDDHRVELAITRVEGGPMSELLHAAKVGDRITAGDPQGLFVLQPLVRPIVFVATGTGVAPFRAMLQAWPEASREHAVTLLFGARTESDVLFEREFSALASRMPSFRFVPTLSRASDAWSGRRGWVQTHLAEIVRGATDVDVYVCGLTKMVADVKRMCREELGVPRKQVHTERYD